MTLNNNGIGAVTPETPASSKDPRDIELQWELPTDLPLPTFQPRKHSDTSSAEGAVARKNRNGRRFDEESPGESSSTYTTPKTTPDDTPPAKRPPPPARTRTEMLLANEKCPGDMMDQVFSGGLRHLASAPSRGGSKGHNLLNMEQQRHPGKPDAKYHWSTKQVDPSALESEKPQEPVGTHTDKPAPEEEDEDGYVTGFPLAIPPITKEFKSTPDIGWYGSAYLLTACAFQPVYGRVFSLFSVKKAYLNAMFFFILGSLLCGVAPNSITLIVGRAIAGFGSAGILTGSFVVVATAVPLQVRPIFMAVVGLMFGVGASVGPLLGGVFTDLVTWRWCFYINLPVGGATVAAMILFFNPRRHPESERKFLDRFLDLDIVGNILLLGASIMLFLALEFTTSGIPWSSAKIIGLLVGCGVVSVLFVLWQRFKADSALMPPRILMQRTVSASCGMAFMTYGAIINLTFFLPVWFQAIKGDSPIISGVNMIPYFAVNAFFSLVAGIFVSIYGYVTPPAVIGSAIGTVGLGLLTLLNPDTTTAQWVGYEVLASAGFGLSIQQGFTAVQTVLDPSDMAVGTAAVVASQSLGGAIFLSVGNSVFQNQLLKADAQNLVPDVDIKRVIDVGAAAFRSLVPANELPLMLEVYNGALQKVFIVGIPLGALAAFISCFIEFKSVREAEEKGEEDEKGSETQSESTGMRTESV
ncbi:hypothetical protein OQA88_4167 [Cercophora sp. LCS_1]